MKLVWLAPALAPCSLAQARAPRDAESHERGGPGMLASARAGGNCDVDLHSVVAALLYAGSAAGIIPIAA
jgi:hypothetical protein